MSDAVILVSKYTDKPLPCYIVKKSMILSCGLVLMCVWDTLKNKQYIYK
jgi:hypothetical protein